MSSYEKNGSSDAAGGKEGSKETLNQRYFKGFLRADRIYLFMFIQKAKMK
jgi:hypothetical protein